MAKMKEEELQRLKRIQGLDDDDLGLDVTKGKRMLIHGSKQMEKGKKAERGKADGNGPDDHDKAKKETPEEQKKDKNTLLIILGSLAFIALIFILLVLLRPGHKELATIDELHQANLEGKLSPEDGYVYNGFSFIKFDNIWYSQLSKNNTIYDVTFNYGPKDVENISVEGQLSGAFRQGEQVYITFDPTGDYLNYIGVANYGLSRSLAWAFGYNMTAGCTKNVTMACEKAGVVQCGDPEHPDRTVIYFKEDTETKVVLDRTCITVQGLGPDIVRAKDRLLLRWYGMMK